MQKISTESRRSIDEGQWCIAERLVDGMSMVDSPWSMVRYGEVGGFDSFLTELTLLYHFKKP